MAVIKIGRNATNQVVLNYLQVSGTHAQIEVISPNTLLLEDLGSANGTFVNDLRVKRCIVSPDDKVKLANVSLDLSAYFSSPPTPPKNDSDIGVEFARLVHVYEHYDNTRKQLKTGTTWKQTAIRAGFALVPFVGNAIAIAICANINEDEKLDALDKEFKINYVCPKCKNFLGYFPFEAVAAKKNCMYCKTIWVK